MKRFLIVMLMLFCCTCFCGGVNFVYNIETGIEEKPKQRKKIRRKKGRMRVLYWSSRRTLKKNRYMVFRFNVKE